MLSFWNNLQDRERWMLIVGAFFCFMILFYELLFAPLSNAVQEKLQLLTEKKTTLVWMKKVNQNMRLIHQPQALSSSKLLTVLAKQLQSTSFHAFSYQLQQTGMGEIQLSYDQVPYNACINWLWSLHQKYKFVIKQFSVERTPAPGLVKMMVVFKTA